MGEDKQVQGGAAFQDPLPSERWMGVQGVQEMHQMEDLLDHPLVEPVGSRYGLDFRRGESHSTSPQDRFRIQSGP